MSRADSAAMHRTFSGVATSLRQIRPETRSQAEALLIARPRLSPFMRAVPDPTPPTVRSEGGLRPPPTHYRLHTAYPCARNASARRFSSTSDRSHGNAGRCS